MFHPQKIIVYIVSAILFGYMAKKVLQIQNSISVISIHNTDLCKTAKNCDDFIKDGISEFTPMDNKLRIAWEITVDNINTIFHEPLEEDTLQVVTLFTGNETNDERVVFNTQNLVAKLKGKYPRAKLVFHGIKQPYVDKITKAYDATATWF